ncbi:hypothetical protein AWN76_010140 [Rhodothermaceae bacterium RA]|nr:hypothetical protein AWN76_010140 [Rhodothermaceae bacterium RA]
MPYECRIFSDQHLGVATLYGPLVVDDFLGAMHGLYEHEDWHPGFAALWDARRVRELVLGERDVAAIVRCTRDLVPRMGTGRAAFVVPREIDHLIARLLIRLTQDERRERQAFREMTEALAWLGQEGLDPAVRESLDASIG